MVMEKSSLWHPLGVVSRLGLHHTLGGVVVVGVLLLGIETLLLPRAQDSVMADYLVRGSEAMINGTNSRYGLYPPEILTSEWAQEVPVGDLAHLGLLHEACLRFNDSVIPWTFGRHGKEPASPESAVISENDPDLLNKMRECPDIDIYLPDHIRNHGYCEDSSAYAKFLKSRLLPRWAIDKKYYDKKTGKYIGYHELCPETPMIVFNHYWDGVPDSESWPAKKLLYLMPNIEMYELEARHYWRVDVVLCKTAICARRVRLWYAQEGNPRNTRVIYTRHTSSDVATLARVRLGDAAIRLKNFSDVQFVHAVGTSVQKGTREVLNCWLSRPDFPPLHVYIVDRVYDGWLKAAYDERIQDSQVQIHRGRMSATGFGRVVAEAAFFLCTSVHEGYGHYINQARASRGVIVATNAPPMNEMLSPMSGVLVAAGRLAFIQQLLGGQYQGEHGLRDVEGLTASFGGKDVCQAVEQVLAMTSEEREQMAARAQKQYLIDMRFFAAKMQELRTMATKKESVVSRLRSRFTS